MRRWLIAGLLLVVSVGVSVALFLAGVPFFFLFLFIPLIPWFRKQPMERTCPTCGWRTTATISFCPYDGARLVETGLTAGGGERERED
ncbi:MAG: hypothetical protein NT074_02640 [Methanomicrobiales archaeon]|nr:hypothetical protein [Methanomicrobiales archaeon]